MLEIGVATEAEMVLAFMRAETNSARFSRYYKQALAHYGQTGRELIDHADLSSEMDNRMRARILGHIRGFGRNAHLFDGFPPDATWRRVKTGPAGLNKLYYGRHEPWVSLSRGTRRVVDGAANLERTATDVKAHIVAIARLAESGQKFPELIAVQDGDYRYVLVEGHARATAFALAKVASPVEILVASSPQMQRWVFL